MQSTHGRSTYALANKGHDTRAIQRWLGRRSITSTAVYTALAPNRFKDFWRDYLMADNKSCDEVHPAGTHMGRSA